jgi:hypothetical protein
VDARRRKRASARAFDPARIATGAVDGPRGAP